MADTACDMYTWSVNSMTYTTSGTYKDTLQTSQGCDSVVTLNLTINYKDSSSMSATACDRYTWSVNSMTYASSGMYHDTLKTVHGCDSVVTLNLTINYSDSSSMSATACDTYTWSVNSMTYAASGMYVDTLNTIHGCDSVVTLNLTIHNSDSSSSVQRACDSYTWSVNSATYTQSGMYSDTLQTVNGCDSIVTLDLTVNYSDSSTTTDVVCFSYTWIANGLTYDSSGVYVDTISTIMGCDSVVTLDLTVNHVDTGVTQNDIELTAHASGAMYQWLDCDNGFNPIAGETDSVFTATQNGNYAVEITENGCVDTSACFDISTVFVSERFAGSIQVFRIRLKETSP